MMLMIREMLNEVIYKDPFKARDIRAEKNLLKREYRRKELKRISMKNPEVIMFKEFIDDIRSAVNGLGYIGSKINYGLSCFKAQYCVMKSDVYDGLYEAKFADGREGWDVFSCKYAFLKVSKGNAYQIPFDRVSNLFTRDPHWYYNTTVDACDSISVTHNVKTGKSYAQINGKEFSIDGSVKEVKKAVIMSIADTVRCNFKDKRAEKVIKRLVKVAKKHNKIEAMGK